MECCRLSEYIAHTESHYFVQFNNRTHNNVLARSPESRDLKSNLHVRRRPSRTYGDRHIYHYYGAPHMALHVGRFGRWVGVQRGHKQLPLALILLALAVSACVRFSESGGSG